MKLAGALLTLLSSSLLVEGSRLRGGQDVNRQRNDVYASSSLDKRALEEVARLSESPSKTKRDYSSSKSKDHKKDKKSGSNSTERADTSKAPKPSGPLQQWDFFHHQKEKNQYRVDSLPYFNITHDVGYAASLPLSDSPDDDRELFFYYIPQRSGTMKWSKTLTVWLGGCDFIRSSTLADFFRGIGPIWWPAGNDVARLGQYSFNNASDLLFLECQTGTAYGLGRLPRTWADIVGDLVDGLLAFYDIFPELKDYDLKFAGTGASVNVMSFLIDWQDQAKGSPLTVDGTTIQPLPVKPSGMFLQSPWVDGGESISPTLLASAKRLQSIVGFEDSDLKKLEQLDQQCGWSAIAAANVHYPGKTMPLGVFRTKPAWPCSDRDWTQMFVQSFLGRYQGAIGSIRDVSRVAELGADSNENSLVNGDPVRYAYWNFYDVIDAVHANPNATWAVTGAYHVPDPVIPSQSPDYRGFDYTYGQLAASKGVLGRSFELVDKVVFAVGDMSMAASLESVAYAMQNITWKGKTGFDKDEYPGIVYGRVYHPVDPSDKTPARATIGGRYRTERGVTLAHVKKAGNDIAETFPAPMWALFANFIDPTFLTLDWQQDKLGSPDLP